MAAFSEERWTGATDAACSKVVQLSHHPPLRQGDLLGKTKANVLDDLKGYGGRLLFATRCVSEGFCCWSLAFAAGCE